MAPPIAPTMLPVRLPTSDSAMLITTPVPLGPPRGCPGGAGAEKEDEGDTAHEAEETPMPLCMAYSGVAPR
jgi:hypothetical protein